MHKQILEITLSLFGDRVLWPDNSTIVYQKSLALSIKDWKIFKEKLKESIPEYKKWPGKYSDFILNRKGTRYRKVKYIELLADEYGGKWRYNKNHILYNYDIIATVNPGMTYREIIETIQKIFDNE